MQSQEGYVAPDDYNDDFAHESLKPSDYSDIGQAKMVPREYGDEFCFTDATDYLRYNGEYWVESKQRAVGAMEEFLDLQLQDALDEVKNAMDALLVSGVDENEVTAGGKHFEKTLEGEKLELYGKYMTAKQYLGFVMKRRDMKYVVSALYFPYLQKRMQRRRIASPLPMHVLLFCFLCSCDKCDIIALSWCRFCGCAGWLVHLSAGLVCW